MNILEKVTTHLLKQNAKAQNNGNCLYWEQNSGNKCAVGCLLKEELYDIKIEAKPINHPLIGGILAQSIGRELTVQEVDVLKQAQRIHDDHTVENWYELLEEAKKDYQNLPELP